MSELERRKETVALKKREEEFYDVLPMVKLSSNSTSMKRTLSDAKSEAWMKKERMDKWIESEIGGPYIVNVFKPYKPVCLLFTDLIFAITMFTATFLFSWKMHINVEDHTFDTGTWNPNWKKLLFVNYRQIFYLFGFFGKFVGGMAWLICCFKK